MLQPGKSLYLANINLSVPILQRIPSEPLWRAVGSNSAVDFAEWVVDQVILWTGVARSHHPNIPLSSKADVIATKTRIITLDDHQVDCLRVELTLRELQKTRHDKLVRYIRSEINSATQATVQLA